MNVIEKSLFSLIDEFIGSGGNLVSSEIKPLADTELDRIEKTMGFRLNESLKTLLRWTGGDWSAFEDYPLHRVNFIPDFFVLNPDNVIHYHQVSRGTDNLGDKSLPKSLRADADVNVPALSTGVDFMSLLARGDSCGIVIKRNDHSVASEFWPSIDGYLDFTKKAWQMGIYRINEKEEGVDFDTDRLPSIIPSSVVYFGGGGY
jgi:hypothetical protein